jgi:pimeloyl-ACP methyl ester carboxylesterase
MQIAIDDDDLRISYVRGAGNVTVVAFSGIGHGFGGIQTEEFRKSLTGGDASVVFVIDKKRSWYNGGMSRRIITAVNKLIMAFGTQHCITLGNSMGGFGAIVFARHFVSCSQAIAFSPQSSVHPAIAPFETRWNEWRDQISAWDVKDAAASLDAGIRYDLFFGAEDTMDGAHAERFRRLATPATTLHVIPACGHEVAAYLRTEAKLSGVLAALVTAPIAMSVPDDGSSAAEK